jgi:serine/threonine protein kinase
VEIAIGTRVAGRYVLTSTLARGGVSTVYQAVDVPASRRVAVKMVEPSLGRLVHHEAEMTRLLSHPHVPKIYDSGETILRTGQRAGFLTLELLGGQSLTTALIHGPLPWRRAVAVAGTAADVLAVAHRRGVVHRDLSPANVMLTPSGTKVVDFGLAEAIGARTRACDDVYALGALLFQMLTGRGRAARSLGPAPVLALPGLPSAVAELCRACLAKNASGRPSAREAALRMWSLLG